MTFLCSAVVPQLWSETGDSRRRRAGAKAFGDLDLAIRHLPASPSTPNSSVSTKRLPRWVTFVCRPGCRNPYGLPSEALYAAGFARTGHGLRRWTVTWGQPSRTRSHAGHRLNRL